MVVLHNNKRGNNWMVAKKLAESLGCQTVAAEDDPTIDNHELVILVLSNTGDEELPQPMEDYLFNLSVFSRSKPKKYAVCELGNYFGFENYRGCKKVAIRLLDEMGWEKVSDISIDSLPDLDESSLLVWIQNLMPLL